jgi:predicted phage terminase large subunit-like protein
MLNLPSRQRVQSELARRSLADFFRHSWHVLEPATPLVWNWHLQAICDHVQALLEGKIPKRNLIINVPPGSSKSRIVSVCTTAWRWIDYPEWRGIYTSANPRNVMRDSTYCRQLIESNWYQQSFRPKWKFARDQNAKGLYRNTAQGFRQALGGGAAVTGDRANGLFMDDMLDAAEAESKAAREQFVVWYPGFANRVSDMKTSTRCMIAQRLHENDPAGHLLKSGDWEHLVIRQEYELEKVKLDDQHSEVRHRPATSIGWTDPRKTPGELMDPARFPADELAKELGRLGTRGYAGQHQQRPAAAGGNIIKRDWLRYYKTPRDSKGDFLAPDLIVKALGITRVLQGVDTALGEKQQNDYTADITGGEAPNKFFILGYLKEKMDAPTGKAAIVLQQAKWNAQGVIIEGGSSASGKAAAQTIRAETRLPVIEQAVTTDKVVGLNKVAPTVEAGVIYLPEDQAWVEGFVESLVNFPNMEHDDDVDAFRILIDYAFYGGGGLGMLEHARRQLAAKKAAAAADVAPVVEDVVESAASYTNGNGAPKKPIWAR